MANDKAESPQDDDLAAAIVAAVKKACAEFTRWNEDNPFYPSRDDLTGLVLIKLISVPQLRNIWNDPDPQTGGPTGLLRFARTVANRTAIDEKRRNEARAPEILAARLDEPIYDENGERTGDTLADIISDEDGTYQAFQFDDLRSEMSDEEFTVLRKSIDGVTQQELAQGIGASDSSISRTYIRAKEKAQKWIEWLKQRTDKQARANIYPTFTRRPCLRPNGIAQETLAHWNGLTVVPFHDEASQWHPPITKSSRVRAARECYNDACTRGGAVGPDNLILPSSQSTNDPSCDFTTSRKAESCDFRTMHGVTWKQSHEQPVRFLPAITGRINEFCEDCAKENKRAEQQIQQAVPVPIASARFFENETRTETSDVQSKRTETRNTMDHKQAAAIIKETDCPRSTIARLAGLHLSDLSSWLNGNLDFSRAKIERVSQAVTDVAKMVHALANLHAPAVPFRPDLTDIDSVKRLIVFVNDSEAQMELPLDDVLQDLPEPIGTQAAAD